MCKIKRSTKLDPCTFITHDENPPKRIFTGAFYNKLDMQRKLAPEPSVEQKQEMQHVNIF